MPDTIASVLAYEADLTKTIQKTILRDLFVTEDKNAHTFRVKITRAGEPVDLTGATVTGYFMRYKDWVSITLTGTVEGSEAVLTLKEGCYSMRTMFCVTLCVALGGAKHAVFAGEGKMVLNRSDAIADPENVIPSVEDIIAQYNLMVSGTNAANTAASSANTAAGKANTAASTANTATSNANAATSRANTAAAAIEGMTVSASDVSAGTPASVEITDDDGAKNIHFNLRQGLTGVTPNITFQVVTGAAGSQVQVSQSGTPENPVVNLTIPRGDPGAVDGVDYYEGNPAALGTASPGTANGLARGNHVHPMPSATDVGAAVSVDGVQVDENGDIPLKAVNMKVVWTNASPTSDFAAQTVQTLNMDGYDYIFVLCRPTKNGTLDLPPTMATAGGAGRLFGLYQAGLCRRDFTIDSATAISFGDSQIAKTYSATSSSSYETNNVALIPTKIVAVKGVS